MRIIYISPLRYPSEKAGSAFSMKSCEAFAGEGIGTELWAPRRLNKLHHEDPFLYHGVKNNFRIVRLPIIDFMPWIPVYLLMAISFAVSVFCYALWRQMRGVVYYSHEEFALFLLTFISRRTVYEIHDFPPRRYFYRRLLKRVYAIVTTNTWKKNKLIETFNCPPERILVIPNAVNINQFAISISREEARARLKLPQDEKIALYAGHLYSWKGADTLLEASRLLPKNCTVYFVGGTEKDTAEFKVKSEKLKVKDNIRIIGYRQHNEIPLWLRAADVLVLPNTAKEDISKYYTSPMKLFEYMASGTPIAASDLPSIREVVTDEDVYFFKPDDPEDMSEKIALALSSRALSNAKTRHAGDTVINFSWDARAKKIITFFAWE